jgi:hypothetical protein
MKAKGIILIVLGILGGIFTCTFDIIVRGKPISIGPISLAALIICVVFVITGVRFLSQSLKK